MEEYGLKIKQDTEGKRLEMRCPHQNGLLYVIAADASWVCSEDLRHAHALAGFFGQLMELDDDQVPILMQRWGLYYRSRAIETEGSK